MQHSRTVCCAQADYHQGGEVTHGRRTETSVGATCYGYCLAHRIRFHCMVYVVPIQRPEGARSGFSVSFYSIPGDDDPGGRVAAHTFWRLAFPEHIPTATRNS